MGIGTSGGYLLWRDESTFGTDPGTGDKTADVQTVEAEWVRNLEKKPALWGVRNYPMVYSTTKYVEGRIVANATEWKFLKHALGSLTENATSAVSAPYYHDFEETEVLPSFTLERQWGAKAYKVLGCKMNTLSIKGEVGQAMELELNFMAKDKLKIDTGLATPSYTQALPFRVTNLATATFGATDINAYIKSFDINMTNNLSVDIGADGKPRAIDEGMREVTGSLTCKFDYTLGDFVLNEDTADITLKVIRGTNDEIEITIEDATFESLNDVTEADSQKEIELVFISQADATNKNCIKVRMTGDQATYY
jgi:hypothetical protein